MSRQGTKTTVEFVVIEIATRQVKWAGQIVGETIGARDAALRALPPQIVEKVVSDIYPLRVVQVLSPNSVVVNQGADTIKVGQMFTANLIGDMAFDPYTREPLGSVETAIGTVKISELIRSSPTANSFGRIARRECRDHLASPYGRARTPRRTVGRKHQHGDATKMVNLKRLATVIILSLIVSPSAFADERPSMAVLPAIASDVVRSQFSDGKLDLQELTRQIQEAVRATRRFSLFERSGEILRSSVLLEQDFAKAGQALHNAAEAGKLANVQFIVQPIITYSSVAVRRMQQEERPGQYRYSASGSLVVTVKLLDTTSGEIMFQTTRETALPQANIVGARQSGPEDEPLVRGAAWQALATDEAGRLTNAVVGSLFPIQVMMVQGADIFINRGEGAGISVGEHYQMFSVGAPLIDPATNEKLGDVNNCSPMLRLCGLPHALVSRELRLQ